MVLGLRFGFRQLLERRPRRGGTAGDLGPGLKKKMAI